MQSFQHYVRLAMNNLRHWSATAHPVDPDARIQVHAGDWGEVTQQLTMLHGQCFAVLNMANAFVPGGGYVEGASAQEENIFRRSSCHFSITPDDYHAARDLYYPRMTRLLQGETGLVYLDRQQPRVCIRGAEDAAKADLGYAWLADEAIFPFFELRAAAQDLRNGRAFDAEEARRRIVAQFNTLQRHKVRHVVLGAFGCGAFANPPDAIARIYREELASRLMHFDCIAFAIRASTPGRDNFRVFAETMHSMPQATVVNAGQLYSC
jgi:hypothetical protein